MSKKAGNNLDETMQGILAYLTRMNRPFSLTDILMNNHNQYSKTVAFKALNQLVQDELISCKTYGKQSVYVIRQDNQENCPTQQELDLYDSQIQELRSKLQEITEENKKLSNDLQKLQQSKTETELKVEIESLEKENLVLQEKLEKLTKGENLVDLDEKRKLDDLVNVREKEYKKRRRLYKEIIDTICESMGKKEKELVEDFQLDEIPSL